MCMLIELLVASLLLDKDQTLHLVGCRPAIRELEDTGRPLKRQATGKRPSTIRLSEEHGRPALASRCAAYIFLSEFLCCSWQALFKVQHKLPVSADMAALGLNPRLFCRKQHLVTLMPA